MTEDYTGIDHVLAPLARFSTGGERAFKPGLDRLNALLAALGDPQDRFPAVHVAGTNGKGSTASMVAAICTAAGLRTGLHTSPHIMHVGERMRVDGRPAPPDWMASTLEHLEPVIAAVQPSYFEVTLALSLAYFGAMDVDIAVVEVGLGGRLDGTNVVHSVLSLVTAIGLDHMDLLGDSLGAIAREKAGIFRPGVPALAQGGPQEVRNALREHADARHVLLEFVDRSCPWRDDQTLLTPVRRYGELRIPLAGAHQRENARLAVRAAEYLAAARSEWSNLNEDAAQTGLAEVASLSGLRGRTEVLRSDPPLMVDVAHNPDGLRAALASFRDHFGETARPMVALGLMKEKDAAAIGASLSGQVEGVLPVALDSARARSTEDLSRVLAPFVPVLDPVRTIEDIEPYLAGPLLIAGSFQLVGPFLVYWEGS